MPLFVEGFCSSLTVEANESSFKTHCIPSNLSLSGFCNKLGSLRFRNEFQDIVIVSYPLAQLKAALC